MEIIRPERAEALAEEARTGSEAKRKKTEMALEAKRIAEDSGKTHGIKWILDEIMVRVFIVFGAFLVGVVCCIIFTPVVGAIPATIILLGGIGAAFSTKRLT